MLGRSHFLGQNSQGLRVDTRFVTENGLSPAALDQAADALTELCATALGRGFQSVIHQADQAP